MQRLFVLRDESHALALYAFLRANWKSMADAGRPLALFVTEHKAKRNTQQNSLYWALLGQIAEEGWLDGQRFGAEAWHEYFKRQYIGYIEVPDGTLTGISTTTLDVHAFADYIDKIQEYAASELGMELI